MSTLVTFRRRAPAQLEGQPDDAGDLVLGVWQRVARRPLAERSGRLGPRPEIEPASELADDEHVDPAKQLRPER